ncbi:DUF861 domain-containing protein [Rhizobium deserti]|uniref:DUF861 domain-containing protein n=1 Tax=Rhizobium deserti TaxID=2547961 RepID=A0A4R5UHH0_9HYPH|nr:cupin domain-containing protein [Rhizobium deserti]TDK35379.1 DUF861 domain-containing protein [Rhizobium deserti]
MSWHVIAASAAALAIRYRTSPFERPASRSFIGTSVDLLEMAPSPIKPAWILSGDPQARTAVHSKADDRYAVTGIWDCTAGAFRWYFGWDETVFILEGEVHVVDEQGHERILRAGDVGYFKAGTWATWSVERYVKKVAFMRRPLPAPIALLHRMGDLLRRKIKRLIGRS